MAIACIAAIRWFWGIADGSIAKVIIVIDIDLRTIDLFGFECRRWRVAVLFLTTSAHSMHTLAMTRCPLNAVGRRDRQTPYLVDNVYHVFPVITGLLDLLAQKLSATLINYLDQLDRIRSKF